MAAKMKAITGLRFMPIRHAFTESKVYSKYWLKGAIILDPIRESRLKIRKWMASSVIMWISSLIQISTITFEVMVCQIGEHNLSCGSVGWIRHTDEIDEMEKKN